MEFLPSSNCVNTTLWMQHKDTEKMPDGNCTRMLQVIVNKSWKQYFMKQQLYSHLPLITKIIQVRQNMRDTALRSQDKLIDGILLWTPTDQQARTYQQQLCTDTVWRTCEEWWMIGMDGERESSKSMLAVWLDFI